MRDNLPWQQIEYRCCKGKNEELISVKSSKRDSQILNLKKIMYNSFYYKDYENERRVLGLER